MSHCIEKPIDEVYSTKPAWHGLEILRPMGITADDVRRLCPKIHEVPVTVTIDGVTLDVGVSSMQIDEAARGCERALAVFESLGDALGHLGGEDRADAADRLRTDLVLAAIRRVNAMAAPALAS